MAYNVTAVSFALLVGLGSGLLMARIAPDQKFSWVGLLVAPLWFLLEIVFELLVGTVGGRSQSARVLTVVVLLVSFYGAWFAFRR